MRLSTARRKLGAPVAYFSPETRERTEFGFITSVDEKWIHVRYSGSPTPIKTHPANLQLRRTT